MILLALSACGIEELSQEWQLDRLRLLAIRAEPAEPVPGDVVTFSSLRYVPGDVDWSAVWFACVAGTSAGCALDPSLVEGFDDFDSLTPEEQAALLDALVAAGFAGVEPGMTPTWTVPEDALDGLEPDALLEGLSATVQVTLATEDDTELVLKDVPVSEATTPNTNPDVGWVTLDGADAGTEISAQTGGTYELVAGVGALEEYTYVTTEGVTETRTEELEWRWYASGGDFGYAYDITDDDPLSDTVSWIAPEDPGDYVIHAVVLDGRGGMGWWSMDVTVR